MRKLNSVRVHLRVIWVFFVDPDLSFDSYYIHVVKKARIMSCLLIRPITFKSKTIMLPLCEVFSGFHIKDLT